MANKENMRQAMKELLGLVGIGDQNAGQGGVDLNEQQQEVAETMEKSFGGVQEEKRFAGGFIRREEPVTEPTVPDELLAAAPEADPYTVRVSGTVIAAGTSIFGDIRAEGDVEIQGKLKGNLEAAGNVRITGKVLGDVKGDSIELIACAVQGNITAASRLRIDQGTVVVGDLSASDLVMDGKVKGSVQVANSASFQSSAVLAGNVSASLVSMSQGAKIQGTVRIAQDSDTNALFGDNLDI